MPKAWIIRRYDSEQARSLAQTLRVPDLVSGLLLTRGLTTAPEASAFLDTNFKEHFRRPFQLPGCRAVAERLCEAVLERKKIVVYGDYDVDGITGTAILRQTLRDLGATDVKYYIPSRLDEGYGLNSEAVEKLIRQDGMEVIVSVDCGIASVEEAVRVRELGAELLITDHHNPGPVLPDAAAIAHAQLVRYPAEDGPLVSPASLTPEQAAEAKKYPFSALCGAAVALKVAWGTQILVEQRTQKPSTAFRKRFDELIGLAAMGTIADYMPLRDENRALVRDGLKILFASASTGLKQLFFKTDTSKADPEKWREKNIDAEFVAFHLAPRLNATGRLDRTEDGLEKSVDKVVGCLNAAGRLGQAALAVELLVNDDKPRTEELADYINKLNESRRSLERRILKQAEEMIATRFDADESAFVLASEDWHRGVLGIVAGRLAERFHVPVILIALDKMGAVPGVGSARSVPGFNLYDALNACADEHLVRFGGHDAAAGLTIEPARIDAFRAAFCDFVAKNNTAPRDGSLDIDGEFPLGLFDRKTIGQISLLAPFGSENPRPIYMARNVYVHNVKPMGKPVRDKSGAVTAAGPHFSAEFRQGDVSLRGIAFHRAEWIEEMKPYDTPLDIVFRAKISDFNGKVELDVLDWRRAEK